MVSVAEGHQDKSILTLPLQSFPPLIPCAMQVSFVRRAISLVLQLLVPSVLWHHRRVHVSSFLLHHMYCQRMQCLAVQ